MKNNRTKEEKVPVKKIEEPFFAPSLSLSVFHSPTERTETVEKRQRHLNTLISYR